MKNIFFYFIVGAGLFCFNNLYAFSSIAQDDTVEVPDVSAVPVIDGTGDDQCWQNVPWQSIDQVWIPYDAGFTTDDYSGHYKLVWSSATNLLYFLIEVNDDAFVDGFIFGQTADVYNFDISEVFIDENTSGGFHIFDATGNDTLQLGSNAENAFTYHIYADFPDVGQATTDHYVGDLDGRNWGNVQNPNYASHLPEFALRKSGNVAVWEFSLIVYNDTYENNNVDPARVVLTVDKIMGLSVAFCDNDNTDGQRDNMFGSVWEPSPGNLHWQNADYFGRVKLVSNITSVLDEQKTQHVSSIKIYPNPVSSSSQLMLSDPYTGEVLIRIFNILGQEVFQTSALKTNQILTQRLSLDYLSSGIYFLQAQMGRNIYSEKFIITDKK